LNHFLATLRLEPELSMRITSFLHHAYALKEQEVSDDQVPVLELLSKPLRRELQSVRYERCLHSLAFIARSGSSRSVDDALKHLAMTGIQQMTMAATDTAFEKGTKAKAVYFLTSGSMRYMVMDAQQDCLEQCKISEMGLWTPWLHVGELSTTEVSTLVVLQVETFCHCLHRNWETLELARAFAVDYVNTMTSCGTPTDLWDFDVADQVNVEQPIGRPTGPPPSLRVGTELSSSSASSALSRLMRSLSWQRNSRSGSKKIQTPQGNFKVVPQPDLS